MSWRLKKKAQALVTGEEGIIRKDWGGRVRTALVYPNTYAVGMSNLGFQTIYAHLNRLPHVVCERVFFPDPADIDEYGRTGTVPFSLESQRPLTDFDLIGFSVTYEGDYINAVRLLRLAGIPVRSADRRPSHPVVIMGGVCAFSNPEPVAPFMGVIVVGGGEEGVGGVGDVWRTAQSDGKQDARSRFLDELLRLGGIYVPAAYDVRYDADGRLAAVAPLRPNAPSTVIKRRLRNVDAFQTRSLVKTPKAEYGHMQLLEVGKGCGRGCRFCLEGQVYRPGGHRSLGAVRSSGAEVAKGSQRGGLRGGRVSGQ